MNFMKIFKTFFAALYLLFMTNVYADEMQRLNEKDRAMFNVQEFEEMKARNDGKGDIQFYRPDGVFVRYSEDEGEKEYSEELTVRGVYVISRLYYQTSGAIKLEMYTFHNITVNTLKEYDQQGHLTREVVLTPSDWIDRLTAIVEEKFHLDVWNPWQVVLMKVAYQNRPVLQIQHLNGKDINRRGGDPVRKFILLDFASLEVVEVGEVHFEELHFSYPNKISTNPKKSIYFVDGKEIFLDK